MVFANLQARLELDSSGFRSGIERAQDSVDNLGSRARNVGRSMQRSGAIMSAGVTAPLAAIGGKALTTAADAEEMRDRAAAVFGDMTDEAEDWAEETADAMGRSENNLLDMATTMQDMLDPTGEMTEESFELSSGLAELATDVASFQNMQDEQVLNKFMSAMAGQSKAVRDLGVDMSAAAVDAELMEMGIEGGSEAASDAEENQARYNILMDQTQAAHGDAARTADTFTGQMRQVRARVSDLAAEFGQHLLPMATALAQNIGGLIDRFEGLSTSQQRIIVAAAGLLAALGPLLLAIGTLLTLWGTMAAGAAAVAVAVGLIASPIGLVVLAIGALAAAFATDFMGIRSLTERVIGDILSFLQPFIDILKEDFIETFEVWREAAASVLGWFEEAWAEHGDTIMAIVGPFLDALSVAFDVAFGVITTIIDAWIDQFVTLVRVGLAILRGDFEGAFELLTDLLDRQIDRFFEIGENLIQALADGVRAAGDLVSDAVEGVLDDARDFLPFSDAKKGPLSDLTSSGEAIPGTMADGADSNMGRLAGAMETIPAPDTASGGGVGGGATDVEIRFTGGSDLEQALWDLLRDNVEVLIDNRETQRFNDFRA